MFFQSAQKGINGFWTYLLGVVVVLICYFIGQAPMMIALFWAMSTKEEVGQDEILAFSENPDFELVGIDSNFGFFLLLFMFIFAIIGLYFMITKVHKRSFMSAISPLAKLDKNRILFGFGLWLLLGLIAEIISYSINPGDYSFQFEFVSFFFLLLIAIFLLPIQTSFEEIFFRGYLLQGFGLWAKNKWAPLVITSILFAGIHSLNPEIAEFGMAPMMIYYITAGLFLGIMTIMDDRLELALGVHAAVNLYGALLVGYKGSAIQTDALFKTSVVEPWSMLIALVVMGIIFLTIAARRYEWPSYQRLFEKIQFAEENLTEDIA